MCQRLFFREGARYSVDMHLNSTLLGENESVALVLEVGVVQEATRDKVAHPVLFRYVWISPRILSVGKESHHFVPLPPIMEAPHSKKHERLVIGHNIAYDRQRIYQEYKLKSSGIKYVDTMSMHNVLNCKYVLQLFFCVYMGAWWCGSES